MWLLRSVYIFFYVATVMAQELPGDYSLWDDSESFKNDDLIDLSVATDLPFTTAGFASPEVESMSPLSCLSWDIMDVQIPSSVRARDEGISSCPAEAPPASSLPSFQDLQQGVWNILDQAGDDDTRKLSPGTESRPARGDLILEDPEDPRSCLPEFPFRLCCRDPGTVGEYQITENTVYTTFRRCELIPIHFCQRYDVCCNHFVKEHWGSLLIGFMCYEVSMLEDEERPDIAPEN